MEEVTRIFDILSHYLKSYDPKDDVIAGKVDGKWVKYDIRQYISAADNISYGLFALGIRGGDRIATISNNRPEWNFLDMGIMQAGAIHVPIYPTISESDYRYILSHAGVRLLFVSGRDILRKIEHILPEISSLEAVYTLTFSNGYKTLDDLIALGQSGRDEKRLQETKEAVMPDDVATLIYTSGTTGNPKGVMLTHRNLLSNVMAVRHIPPFGQEAKALSYLPLCHVYERILTYVYQYLGISVYYAENIGTIGENLQDVQPDILSTVPRLLEKMYDKLVANGRKLKGFRKQIFFWALHLGLHYELNGVNGWYYETRLALARKLVYSTLKQKVCANLKIIVSGGAALQPRLSRLFWAMGYSVLEGYGLTETSPVIAVQNFGPNGVKFGTVGPVLSNVSVRISDEGEILAKGPSLMKGYFEEPGLTKAAIDEEGWFHTGDVGHIEPEGQLKITGRIKEIFKTSMGKYISPELIENKFKESPFIDTMLVVGEHQKFAAALIVPDFAHLRSWCGVKEIEYTTDHEMVTIPRIRKRFEKEIHKYNKFFGETEQIKRFHLMEAEWSIETGELTPSLKLKRKFLSQKYKDQIDRLFE